MIYRLLNVPLSKNDYTEELNTIYQIAKNNGYKTNDIDKILKKQLHRNINNSLYPSPNIQDKQFFKILYTGQQSYQISNLISKRMNSLAAFYSSGSLGSQLINSKTKVEKINKCGVYKLQCSDCPSFYIGQTGTSFKLRFDQHRRDVGKEDPSSAFAQHLNSASHACNFNTDFSILHLHNKGRKLDALENIEIRQATLKNQLIVNDLLFTKNTPIIEIAARHT